MSTIILRLVQEDEASINFHVNLDKRGSTGYEANVQLYNKNNSGWVAQMSFETTEQDTPEDAIDRMGLYLREMAKAMKGKNIKHINIEKLFKPVYKK